MVVIIVAISTGIIVPNLIHFISDYDLTTEAKKMRSKIRYAQQLAITAQETYQISFDTTNEKYAIYDSNGTIVGDSIPLENDIGIDGADFTLSFDYFGAPTGGEKDITLSSPKDSSTVTISIKTTGRVKIKTTGGRVSVDE